MHRLSRKKLGMILDFSQSYFQCSGEDTPKGVEVFIRRKRVPGCVNI